MLIYALCSTVWGLMACLMIVECSIYPAPLALHQVWSTASLAVSCTHTYSCTRRSYTPARTRSQERARPSVEDLAFQLLVKRSRRRGLRC